jgi:ketosteroid isomerase-like protein
MMSVSTEDNKRVALSLVSRWFEPSAWEELTSDDLQVWVNADPEIIHTAREIHSKADCIEELRTVNTHFPEGIRMDFKGVIAEGDQVAVRSVAVGARAGAGDESIQEFHLRFHNLFHMRHGKVSKIMEFYDTAYRLDRSGNGAGGH